MSCAAVILAGGQGRRLGGAIKANIEFRGNSLLRRVSEALDDPSPIIVAHGSLDVDSLGLAPEHVPVPDLDTGYGGPLAGLAAAVDYLSRPLSPPLTLISVAVDTPRIPADFVPSMTAALSADKPAIVVRYAGQDYPTNAIWSLAAIRDLPGLMRAGAAPRSLRAFAAQLGAGFLEWPQTADGDPFASVNTPSDLLALGARLPGPARS